MKPVMYMFEELLKNIKLDCIIREVRNKLCPSNTFDYFDDCE